MRVFEVIRPEKIDVIEVFRSIFQNINMLKFAPCQEKSGNNRHKVTEVHRQKISGEVGCWSNITFYISDEYEKS